MVRHLQQWHKTKLLMSRHRIHTSNRNSQVYVPDPSASFSASLSPVGSWPSSFIIGPLVGGALGVSCGGYGLWPPFSSFTLFVLSGCDPPNFGWMVFSLCVDPPWCFWDCLAFVLVASLSCPLLVLGISYPVLIGVSRFGSCSSPLAHFVALSCRSAISNPSS